MAENPQKPLYTTLYFEYKSLYKAWKKSLLSMLLYENETAKNHQAAEAYAYFSYIRNFNLFLLLLLS